MKTNVIVSLVALFVSASVVNTSAIDNVTVTASRGIRVAVIDNSTKFDLRAPLRDALEASFSAGMTRESKTDMPVRLKIAEADRAAADLNRGYYDGVVVVGNSVPASLLTSDIVVLKATNARGQDMNRTFYLLARNDDPLLQRVMGAAFELAVQSAGFQQALRSDTSAAAVSLNTR